ncbi:hypothetical protein FRC15_009113 [Serendipita sp. 397]|nr:hypothetical protein FRC15_009113 [Serendipita sp. 397]KAG8837920.1 hypothetical protein FRC18_007263 [Serendipita sp. 400]
MQVTSPSLVPTLRQKMQSSQVSPSSNSGIMQLLPSFRIAPTHRHGQGAFATKPISIGELIHVEAPLVIQDDMRSAQSILSSLCVQPTTLTQAYLNLHNAFGDGMEPLLGIFNSNCIPLAPVEPVPTVPDSILEHGVFLQLARFNNSCNPNTSLTWDERRSRITVHAIQPISAGAEITISYGQPMFAVKSDRRDYLQRTMGFLCTCSCCSLTGEASSVSDARRTELWRLFKAVPFLGHDGSAGLRAATQALQTLQTEGLHLYQDSFAFEAYQFCMLLCNATQAEQRATATSIPGGHQTLAGRTPTIVHARQWLERAYQWKVIASGCESDGATFFAQMLAQLPL